MCVCVCVGANPQNKPAEPERLALAVHVLNVGMVVSVYRGVLNLLSMSHGHLHTLYTFTQHVWVMEASHTDTHVGCVCLVCFSVYVLYVCKPTGLDVDVCVCVFVHFKDRFCGTTKKIVWLIKFSQNHISNFVFFIKWKKFLITAV